MEVQAFEWHLEQRIVALGREPHETVSPEEFERLMTETANEFYGGWTEEARRIGQIAERSLERGLSIGRRLVSLPGASASTPR